MRALNKDRIGCRPFYEHDPFNFGSADKRENFLWFQDFAHQMLEKIAEKLNKKLLSLDP